MDSKRMQFVKYILFIFNLLFFVSGVALIIAGVVIQTRFNTDFAFFENSPVNHVAILLIGVGLIIFTLGFFGCCGAYKENRCLLLTFSFLLGVVFLAEIGAAIAAHMMKNEIEKFVWTTMTQSSRLYPHGRAVQQAWDVMQRDYECCGVSNYTDWKENEFLNMSVPDSCCTHTHSLCGANVFRTGNTTNINQEGCGQKFLDISEIAVVIVISIAIGVAILQIAGILLACLLASRTRGEYQPM